jgi:hypothetical protein
MRVRHLRIQIDRALQLRLGFEHAVLIPERNAQIVRDRGSDAGSPGGTAPLAGLGICGRSSVKFTVTVVTTSTGRPFSKDGLYFHSLTASTAA